MTRSGRSLVILSVVVSSVCFSPASALACSACYGDPSSPVSKGLTWAITALVIIVLAVLGAVIAFFVHAHRKAVALSNAEDSASGSIEPVVAGQLPLPSEAL